MDFEIAIAIEIVFASAIVSSFFGTHSRRSITILFRERIRN